MVKICNHNLHHPFFCSALHLVEFDLQQLCTFQREFANVSIKIRNNNSIMNATKEMSKTFFARMVINGR